MRKFWEYNMLEVFECQGRTEILPSPASLCHKGPSLLTGPLSHSQPYDYI